MGRSGRRGFAVRVAAKVAALAAIAVLGTLAWRQCAIWRDSESLWLRAYAAAPEACDRVLALAYRLFPDSAAARGRKDARPHEEPELSSRAVAFAHLVPGVHW